MMRGIAILMSLVLAGCATGGREGGVLTQLFARSDAKDAAVSEAQACAIGYDLARAIHERVSLRRVVIVTPKSTNACERHALGYLRSSGFRIAEAGMESTFDLESAPDQGGVSFDIELARHGGTITAIATIGGDLRIARSYLAVRTGVIADGPVSVQHLDPDTYGPREEQS